MNQQKNDDGSGAGAAIIFGAFVVVGLILAALFCFAAIVIGVLCWWALDKPLTLGKIMITPSEAEAYLVRGLIGAISLPAFIWFLGALGNTPIEWGYLGYMILGGYAFGSLGIELMMGQKNMLSETEVLPPLPPVVSPPPRPIAQKVPSEPFQFASWTDEGGR